ncbi:NAD(P)/FAD-dependent oxidoreductase [Kiloniella sp.]|uniref:NAD(P)/FAD-dependent oxidoreductase n=1 Tax=Kiloniella sp. TaxID=1938587 RepID=UPI003A941F66
MSGKIAIIGAGIVGVCCAVELIERGFDVTLIDKNDPGKETSYGNAGVIARSSLVPLNHPGIWKSLPKLLRNKATSFRYNPYFLAANTNWTAKFLKHANDKDFLYTATALDNLIKLSTDKHEQSASKLDLAEKFNKKGWFYLYRTDDAFRRAKNLHNSYQQYNIKTEIMDQDRIFELEPSLTTIFNKGLWIQDTYSYSDPGALVSAYADYFKSLGGTIIKSFVQGLEKVDQGYHLILNQQRLKVDQVVVALGPWAKDFLRNFGYQVPLAFERGYHLNYTTSSNHQLTRPVYDVEGGYVLAPMKGGVRLTTGVELTSHDAPPNYKQIKAAEISAREAFPLKKPLEEKPWLGSRPTLPDCRPIIGSAPRHNDLWLAIGHQHIGFSTGPGTASILGALISGENPPIDAKPFRAERFIS